jgi:uncharacterized membrane protein
MTDTKFLIVIERIKSLLSDKYPFGADDLVQQVVGSVILISPFIFTEEVWRIAETMDAYRTGIALLATFLTGHGVLYTAKKDRDWDSERKFLGVTFRYLSLMTVAFGTVFTIIYISGSTQTFNAGTIQTLKVISITSIFSVIGAAITDSLV